MISVCHHEAKHPLLSKLNMFYSYNYFAFFFYDFNKFYNFNFQCDELPYKIESL